MFVGPMQYWSRKLLSFCGLTLLIFTLPHLLPEPLIALYASWSISPQQETELVAAYGFDRREHFELLHDLDRQFPGIRFRIVDEQDRLRQHIKFFVNREQVGAIDTPLAPSDEVHVFQALSGG